MTVSKLPSGRFRAQAWSDGKWVSVPKIIGGEGSYATRKDAEKAKRLAQVKLDSQRTTGVTVAAFRDRWTTDPLFARPSESTNLHYAERTYRFAQKYGSLPLHLVGDDVVAEWLAGGKRIHTVAALRAMFNDARSAKAGRLVDHNPFEGLRISRSRGNKDRQPPTLEQAQTLIKHAHDLTPPSFAAFLEVACWSACRPGELDALTWDAIDFERGEIDVRRQFNAKTRKIEAPKHHYTQTVTLTPLARKALEPLVLLGAVVRSRVPSRASRSTKRG
jgi:integrase